ncbi:hypothetical protein GUJ93_ZPchr0011g26901 [Zizania palustris]|uniref:Uncharacterized protein n=1 Tax=Zizania palustris TaxID=103762 RepID=A0A8J5WI33_ZIZPA|nr:hypothetical protein GUJ93_ZPchr0011g26901 [Zizania palustris]
MSCQQKIFIVKIERSLLNISRHAAAGGRRGGAGGGAGAGDRRWRRRQHDGHHPRLLAALLRVLICALGIVNSLVRCGAAPARGLSSPGTVGLKIEEGAEKDTGGGACTYGPKSGVPDTECAIYDLAGFASGDKVHVLPSPEAPPRALNAFGDYFAAGKKRDSIALFFCVVLSNITYTVHTRAAGPIII